MHAPRPAQSSRRPARFPWLLLVCGAVVPRVASLQAQGPPPLTVEQWRADLSELVEHVENNHRNPFHSVAPEEWRTAVAALEGRIPELAASAIVAEMGRLLAMVEDGHTRLTYPVNSDHLGYRLSHTPDPDPAPGSPRFSSLPVRFAEFEEGIYIISASTEFASLIGSRVTNIEGRPVEEVLGALAPFVSSDTPVARRFNAVKLLSVPDLLMHAGMAEGTDEIRFTIATSAAPSREVVLSTLAYDESSDWTPAATPGLRTAEEPYFELERLPDAVLRVDIFQINDHATETLGDFSRRLWDEIADMDPDRVILDLRRCHGGDQSLSRALVLPLIRWEKSSRPGHLFALVGPETFSAAVNLSSRLEEWTQVTFVGEPLGSGPSHYSSSDREILDHSGLVVRVSTGYFVGWTGTESRESVEIGAPVKMSSGDYFTGEDTVLRAALEWSSAATPAEQIVAAHESGGINAALITWSRYRTDPATADYSWEDAGNHFGRHLFESGELRFAAGIFLFNREFHPNSIDAYLGEAEARGAMGDSQQALEILEEARSKSPSDARILRLIERIRGG